MSSERVAGSWSFTCDSCPEFIETEQRDFTDALGEAKAAGWIAYNVSGEWCHACPDCKDRPR